MSTRMINKGSAQANFFSDFLKFRQKYYDPEPTDEFFQEVIDSAKVITDKYENEDFGEFARKIVLCHIEDLDIRVRENKNVTN